MTQRHIIAAGLALCVTFALFYVMQALISMGDAALDKSTTGKIIEFVRLQKDTEVQEQQRKLPDRPENEEPPPPPDIDMSQDLDTSQDVSGFAIDAEVDVAMKGGINIGAGAGDSDVAPIVRVEPQYPLRAAERGIEGWVELQFTISSSGTTKDVEVLAAHPGTIFNRAAVRAVTKWKYNPKYVEGKAVERPGVKVRLTFRLPGGA